MIKEREAFQKYLFDYDIHTVIHYSIPRQKQKTYPELNESHYISEGIHEHIIFLPMSPVIRDVEVETIYKVINSSE